MAGVAGITARRHPRGEAEDSPVRVIPSVFKESTVRFLPSHCKRTRMVSFILSESIPLAKGVQMICRNHLVNLAQRGGSNTRDSNVGH